MAFELEGLLIALAFLLPGFLTSRLIAARTPVAAQKAGTFEETLNSLLKSVSIHLIIGLIVLVLAAVRFLLVKNGHALLSRTYSEALQAYYGARPVEVLSVLFGWLVAAFVVALLFGCIWDPIEYLLQRLATRSGKLSVDPLSLPTKRMMERREQGQENCQLWVQVRLKNGCMYQGELKTVGYRDKDKSRELLLENLEFFSDPAQATDEPCFPRNLYDFVFIDFANCESLEMILANTAPSQMSNTNQA